MRRDFLKGYLFSAGAALFFASGHVLARAVVREVATPLVTSAFSMLFGAIFLFLFVLPRFGRDVRQLNKRRGVFLFVGSGLAGGLAMMAMFYAFHYSPVAVVSSVSNVYPIFTLLFVHLFLQHLEHVLRLSEDSLAPLLTLRQQISPSVVPEPHGKKHSTYLAHSRCYMFESSSSLVRCLTVFPIIILHYHNLQ